MRGVEIGRVNEGFKSSAYRAVAVGFVHLGLEVFYLFGFLLQVGLHVGLPLHGALQLRLQHVLLVSQLRVHLHEALQLLLELHNTHIQRSTTGPDMV